MTHEAKAMTHKAKAKDLTCPAALKPQTLYTVQCHVFHTYAYFVLFKRRQISQIIQVNLESSICWVCCAVLLHIQSICTRCVSFLGKFEDLIHEAKVKDMTHEAKAKDITHEAKAKDYKNCPRGCSRPRTCPRGLYRYLTLMTQLMSDKYISVGVFQSIRNFYSGLSNVTARSTGKVRVWCLRHRKTFLVL